MTVTPIRRLLGQLVLATLASITLVEWVLAILRPEGGPLGIVQIVAPHLALLGLVLVVVRLIWPPDLTDGVLDVSRETGAWLGLVATSGLLAGCLASIRDERLPQPEQPVDPRLVQL